MTPSIPSLAEWRHERDPELRAEGLLQLAGRLSGEEGAQAAELYAALLEDPSTPSSVRERAQSRLLALQGEGSVGAQAEVLLSRFVQEATEPSTLLALTAAGLAYRSTRFLMLGRLAASPQTSLFTRGFGARALAGATGFGVEGLVFPLAGQAGNALLGREQSWSAEALGSEVASSYLMLGALRLGGLTTGSLASRSLRPWVQPVGMYGGLLLGHELEVQAGLRAPTSLSNSLLSSLATLLQFQVAGRLSRSLAGEGVARWERSLEMRSEVLGRRPLNPPLFQRGEFARPALAGVRSPVGFAEAPRFDAVFSIRSPEETPSTPPPPSVPARSSAPMEVRVHRDGRARPIDRQLAPNIRVIEGQGVFWLIDSDTRERRRDFTVRVGEEILPPGGSLRVRPGDAIQIGSRRFRFAGTPPPPPTGEVVARRSLHASHPGSEQGFRLRFNLQDRKILSTRSQVFAEGPQGPAWLQVVGQEGGFDQVRVHDASGELPVRLRVEGSHWVLENFPLEPELLATQFLDWLATRAYVEAASLEVRNVSPRLHDLLEFGLVQDHSRPVPGSEGRDVLFRPCCSLLPPELGHRHRAAADRDFAEWSTRRLGFRVPTLREIETGKRIAPIDSLGLEPRMDSILSRLVKPGSRFLEVGYGERLETLHAAERLGARALGLEFRQTYPEGTDPAEARQGELDVLFLNGSPFLYFAGHQLNLPGAFELLRPAARAHTLLIQAYNPLTPFEILRHLEEWQGLVFEPLYYRSAASLSEAPIFPTDWCQRPDTPHAVLVARRRD